MLFDEFCHLFPIQFIIIFPAVIGLVKPFVTRFIDIIVKPAFKLEPVNLRCIADEIEVEVFWVNISILVLDPLIESI